MNEVEKIVARLKMLAKSTEKYEDSISDLRTEAIASAMMMEQLLELVSKLQAGIEVDPKKILDLSRRNKQEELQHGFRPVRLEVDEERRKKWIALLKGLPYTWEVTYVGADDDEMCSGSGA